MKSAVPTSTVTMIRKMARAAIVNKVYIRQIINIRI